MNSNLRFSIVTPSFNQGAYLEEALLSVSNQKPTPFEHLVMDGGSQDSSLDILQRHSPGREGHLRWRSASDRGQSHALNEGFLRATGDIVGWLNSDDRYRPGCFEAVSRAFREYPEADIIYGDYTWIDERGRLLRIRREIEFSYFVLLYHRVLYIPTTATFFRRRIFQEGNLLDENLGFAMDYEFFVRLAIRGYHFQHIPVLLSDFRFHVASKTCSMPEKQLQEQNYVMELYSPLLRNRRSSWARGVVFTILRPGAAAVRYFEKMIRGYYFDQLRRPTVA
jgi:glycosyltransferase involved in cell wall biosynthesis